jgi:hypothetical protein
MPGAAPSIHALAMQASKDVDARDERAGMMSTYHLPRFQSFRARVDSASMRRHGDTTLPANPRCEHNGP